MDLKLQSKVKYVFIDTWTKYKWKRLKIIKLTFREKKTGRFSD